MRLLEIKWVRRFLWGLIFISLSFVGMLVFLSNADSANFLKHSPSWVLYTGVSISAGLALLLVVILIDLFISWRKKYFGSQLTVKLTMLLSTFVLIPGLVLYAISAHFLSDSLESWFSPRVEDGLDAAMTLSSDLVKQKQDKLRSVCLETEQAVFQSSRSIKKSVNEVLEQKRNLYQLEFIRLIDQKQTPLAQAGQTKGLMLDYGIHDWFQPDGWGTVDIRDDQLMRLQVVTPLLAEGVFCHVAFVLGEKQSLLLQSISQGQQDYQALKLGRSGLRKLFGVALSLVFVLGMLVALMVALSFSRRLVEPLLKLIRGTAQASRGEYVALPIAGKDEMATLTEAFNDMVLALDSARHAVEEKQNSLKSNNAFLRSILEEVRAGVLILDADFFVMSTNPAAAELLGMKEEELPGLMLLDLPLTVTHGRELQNAFLGIKGKEKAGFVREMDIETHLNGMGSFEKVGEQKTWLFRGSWLPDMDLALLFFEDVSALITARKNQTWGEVAQRIAHEIRNPLMPIRLTAERLQMKLGEKLKGTDAALLTKGTNTIVQQVESLKMLVESLRNLSGETPILKIKIDLLPLIQEFKILYEANAQVDFQVSFEVDSAWVEVDADRIRQVFHNLIKNAIESVLGKQDALVHVRVFSKQSHMAVAVEDNGNGFSKGFLSRAFEPHVTTKSYGSGLGLAIVKKIVDAHGAEIYLSNIESDQGKTIGARVLLLFSSVEPPK